MKTKILLLSLLPAIIFIFSSCETQKKATGLEDQIIVVSDSNEFLELEGPLLQVFSKVIYTPQPENLFNLKRISLNGLEKKQGSKNILIVAPLNSGSRVSDYIHSILDSASRSLVMSDSAFVINKYDLWARNQLVMILSSPNIERLKYNILNSHEDLLYNFQTLSNKRLYQNIYSSKFEKKDIEARFLKDYGWMIYVQSDFHLAANSSSDNFVWLRRAVGSDMERWIFVHWIDDASPDYLKPDSIYNLRNGVTRKHLRAMDESGYVEISDNYRTTSEVNFQNRYALMTQGLWRMNDKSMGGPFVNYTFYDEKSKRIYMLDGSIYAPKYYKKKLIQQVDVMLQSFMTEDQISDDRKEDLLDEIEE